MEALPRAIVRVLREFEEVFSERIWDWVQVLVVGAILAPGQRTVAAVLRVMGLSEERQFQDYHRVLNRATWSGLAVSRILLVTLVGVFVPADAPVVVGLDDTIERRWGAKIAARGIYRDPVRSSRGALRQGQRAALDLGATAGADSVGGAGLGVAVPDRVGAVRALRPATGAAAQDAVGLGTPDHQAAASLAAGAGAGGGG